MEKESKELDSDIPSLQDPIVTGAWFQLECHTVVLLFRSTLLIIMLFIFSTAFPI
jgi:hypothetical protein